MKLGKKLLFGAGLLFGVASTAASAAEPTPGPYLSLHGGLLWINDVIAQQPYDDDNSVSQYGFGFRLGGALGYQLNSYVAVESELSYGRVPLVWVTNNDNTTGPLWSNPATGSGTALTMMGNVVLGVPGAALHPYVGFGGGAAYMVSETHTMNEYAEPLDFYDTDWAWAGQVFAGVEFAVSHNMSIGARYRVQFIGPFNLYEEIVPGGLINIGPTIWQSVELTVKFAVGGN